MSPSFDQAAAERERAEQDVPTIGHTPGAGAPSWRPHLPGQHGHTRPRGTWGLRPIDKAIACLALSIALWFMLGGVMDFAGPLMDVFRTQGLTARLREWITRPR